MNLGYVVAKWLSAPDSSSSVSDQSMRFESRHDILEQDALPYYSCFVGY